MTKYPLLNLNTTLSLHSLIPSIPCLSPGRSFRVGYTAQVGWVKGSMLELTCCI